MGIHIIKMPDIGEGIAEVELVAWHVQVGDTVREDQNLADVMTDKAAVEIPSPVAGKVLALGGKLGEMMAVGSELIRLEVEGEGNVSADEAATPAAATPATAPAATPPAPAAAPATPAAQPAATPAPAAKAPASAPRTGSPASAAPVAQAAPAARNFGEAPLASPAVRRRAWDLGIELQFVPGSGPHGRILHEDLDAYMQRASGQGGPASHAGSGYAMRTGVQQVPVIGLRRKIAEKMQESKRRIPHFTYVEEVDVTELEALRGKLNAQYGKERGKLTMIPFIARAMVVALRDFPQINARFDDDAGIVTRYDGVHLGIAAQTDGGLVVPVLRHAESRDLWGNAAEVARLAEAARAGKATRDELSGSTITLTSLGALGGIVSTPVINHPEVGIVGVNRLVEKPVVLGGQIVIRKTMNLSSSFDHRVVDGMDAARFIQAIRALLETPAQLFID
ncbi:dihydrolipoamide acetyltransferase family protein [Vandammella animalimorsus]|uniref:Dihydrolipoamide acetyltransferase component of pyruvate dehydrogenase complex n=1 Tax=Vandammella animalimorsus TaxID=2029117 RepID=A0A2A2AJS2_9BURK|nr:dihydrolipoamide acetyltransferase family protein [Vandammella animalimorsus]PAT37984.1 branched-chain alpha-keto acid dehydrogenase subunit E2 [Vandammella animalimorsus]